MTITPVELRNFQFAKKMRGYDPVDVDAVIEEAAGELESLISENHKLEEEIGKLRDRLKTFENIEQSLQQALVTAEEAAKQQQEAASKQAEIRLKQAENEIERKLYSSRREIDGAAGELAELRRQKQAFIAEMQALLQTHLRLLAGHAPKEDSGGGNPETLTLGTDDNRHDEYGSYSQDQ
jgi:cell division initiation protein